MSYGLEPKPRVRKGGGGMMFIIILMVGAFLLFSNLNGNRGVQPSPERGHSPEEVLGTKDYEDEQLRKDILGGGGDFDGRPMPTKSGKSSSGDWQIEDVASNPDGSAKSTSNTPSKTTKGDWSIEDVDTKKNDFDQFKFSSETDAASKKKTGGGDWKIEDAGTESKRTSGKKTEKGDWSIEETNTSEK